MVPRIARRGHSFKGAGLYYLHDKDSNTSDRVGFTVNVNLVSRNPEGALREMAWTDMHSDDLRAATGGSRAGRKSSAGNVYSYSLAWGLDDNPSQSDMERAALETLEALGLKEHQAVIVDHKDTEHRHVHVIANLVHPQTGQVANVYKDHLTLSQWAQSYEERQGHIYCPQRVHNNAKREQGDYIKHREEQAGHAPSIAELYASCDSGKAFKAALEDVGYQLGRGDRRGFIVMEKGGKVHSLSRQLKGQRAKDIKTYMSDLNISALPDAKGLEKRLNSNDDEDIQVVIDHSQEAIEAFISASHTKRKALIKTLDEDYAEEEKRLKDEYRRLIDIIELRGLRGLWNRVSGRTAIARDAAKRLQEQERYIKNKRIEAVKTFEKQQREQYDILMQSLRQRRALNGWCSGSYREPAIRQKTSANRREYVCE